MLYPHDKIFHFIKNSHLMKLCQLWKFIIFKFLYNIEYTIYRYLLICIIIYNNIHISHSYYKIENTNNLINLYKFIN